MIACNCEERKVTSRNVKLNRTIMLSSIIKFFELLIGYFIPGKLKEIQVKVSRLNVNNINDVDDFLELYAKAFPNNGNNYTTEEIVELFDDIKNNKKHVKADNIILIAKYKDSIIGFIACFYYPEKEYGIIGYFAKAESAKEQSKYVSLKLLQKLKNILLEEHSCKLVVFELENERREAKAALFKLYAKNLGLTVKEAKFNYIRPKMSLIDNNETQLLLMLIPIKEKIERTIRKDKMLDILSFIHYYCYGDYYDNDQKEFAEFREYLITRMHYYDSVLPGEILTI